MHGSIWIARTPPSEHDKTLRPVMPKIMKYDTGLFWQPIDNRDSKRWLEDIVFKLA